MSRSHTSLGQNTPATNTKLEESFQTFKMKNIVKGEESQAKRPKTVAKRRNFKIGFHHEEVAAKDD